MSSRPGPAARDGLVPYRTVDWTTVAVLGVAIGVVFWGWDQLYYALSSVATVAFPPSAGLFGGVWLLGGVVGGLVVRKPGAAFVTEVVASSVEALLGNSWGITNVVAGAIQGLGAEVVLALFLYRRFGPLVAMLAGTAAAVSEALYEWAFYYPDWVAAYRWAHLGMFALSGAVVAGLGGWTLVRALARTGVLDAFGPGRERLGRGIA